MAKEAFAAVAEAASYHLYAASHTAAWSEPVLSSARCSPLIFAQSRGVLSGLNKMAYPWARHRSSTNTTANIWRGTSKSGKRKVETPIADVTVQRVPRVLRLARSLSRLAFSCFLRSAIFRRKWPMFLFHCLFFRIPLLTDAQGSADNFIGIGLLCTRVFNQFAHSRHLLVAALTGRSRRYLIWFSCS